MGPGDIADVSGLLDRPAFWTVAHFLIPLIIIGSIRALGRMVWPQDSSSAPLQQRSSQNTTKRRHLHSR
jgi:hypothetical protein